MTTAEVAAYLRLKERSVYEMASKRQIPCSRATGKLLFSRRMIDRWIEAADRDAAGSVARPAADLRRIERSAARMGVAGIRQRHRRARGRLDGRAVAARRAARRAWPAFTCATRKRSSYNTAFIRREVPAPDIVAIRFAAREQGLVVAPANPLGIGGIESLRGSGIRMALRPEGSGSRLLLDIVLAEAEISLPATATHERIAQTQEDLADLVAGGEADCGLGISAAAALRGLAFVPLGIHEEFDLVMRRRDYFEPPLQALFAFMRSEAFARRAQALGGYDIARAGAVVFNG